MKLYQRAALCASAYKQPGETEYTFCKRLSRDPLLAGLKLMCLSEAGVEGFIAIHPTTKHAIVALRGTEGVQDFLTDIRTWRSDNLLGKGKVHKGVHAYLLPAWNTIVEVFADEGVVSCCFFGHSLGGMLSLLAAEWVVTNLSNIALVEVTTFGSPPVGDAEFCESLKSAYNVKVEHVVNCLDHVPRLLSPFLMNFEVCGTVIYIDHMKRIIRSPTYWQKFKDWLGWCWKNKRISTGFSFHSREQYRSILEELQI